MPLHDAKGLLHLFFTPCCCCEMRFDMLICASKCVCVCVARRMVSFASTCICKMLHSLMMLYTGMLIGLLWVIGPWPKYLLSWVIKVISQYAGIIRIQHADWSLSWCTDGVRCTSYGVVGHGVLFFLGEIRKLTKISSCIRDIRQSRQVHKTHDGADLCLEPIKWLVRSWMSIIIKLLPFCQA